MTNNGKHPGGRPPKWTEPKALQKAVDDYFQHCLDTIITVQHAHSKGITEVKTPTPPTMAGLACWLGIARETLNQYGKGNIPEQIQAKDETAAKAFSDIIMHARDRIHANNVEMGIVGAYEPKINALNLASNYGYSIKSEVSQSGTLTVQVVNYAPQETRQVTQEDGLKCIP